MKGRCPLLCCLSFMLLTFGCAAQDAPVISSAPPAPPARYPIVRAVGSANVSYNSNKNETISSTQLFRIYEKDSDYLSLGAEFISLGTRVAEPQSVALKIFSMGKDRTYVDDRTLKVFVDEKEIISDNSRFISANASNVILGQLKYEVPLSDFVKISAASKVRVQVGPTHIVLIREVIDGFKDLVQTIEK